MKTYIYPNQSGIIESAVRSAHEVLDPNAVELVDCVIDTGALVSEYLYINFALIYIGECPGDAYEVSTDTASWVYSIQKAKKALWNQIKTKRTEIEFGEFTYNGMIFDGDVDAQRRLGSYISVSKTALLNNQPFSASFTLANNTEVVLTAEDFVAIEIAKVTQMAQAFAHAATLRAQINAAASAEEIEAITW